MKNFLSLIFWFTLPLENTSIVSSIRVEALGQSLLGVYRLPCKELWDAGTRSVWHCMEQNQTLGPRVKADTPPDYSRIATDHPAVSTFPRRKKLSSNSDVTKKCSLWVSSLDHLVAYITGQKVLPASDMFLGLCPLLTNLLLAVAGPDPIPRRIAHHQGCLLLCDARFSSFNFPCDNFQLISWSLSNVWHLFFLEFPWGIFGMGCSWPLFGVVLQGLQWKLNNETTAIFYVVHF